MAKTLKQMKKFIKDAETYIHGGWEENQEAIPTVSGCALFMDVPRRTLRKWMDADDGSHFDPFPKLREELLSVQEVTLLSRGLRGTYAPTIAKLVLHKHGYNDKTETDLTSSDGSMSKPDKILIVGKSCGDSDD